MKKIQEVTDWDYPNHLYLLNDADKLVAYVKASEEQWTILNKPLPFHTRGRKFKLLWSTPKT